MTISTDQQLAWSERVAAQMCGLSFDTFRRYRRQGRGPCYVCVGGPSGPIRYLAADVRRWMESAAHPDASYSRTALFNRYQNLIAIVCKHADVTPDKADELLQGGYLERWIKQLFNDDGPVPTAKETEQ